MASGSPRTRRPLSDLHLLSRSGFLIRRRHGELRGFRCVEPGLIAQNPVSATSLQTRGSAEPSESLFQLNVCFTSPPLRSAPLRPSAHPPFSSTSSPLFSLSYFLLLVVEPSSSPPHLSLLYLSSHYFSVLFHFFFQLIVGVSRSTF